MSQAGLRRFTPHATITLIVASNLSDLDIVTVLQGSTAYLEHHRGITHSLVGVTALAGILAALMIAGSGLLARMRGRLPGKLSFLPLFGVCLAGTASHLLLDFTNSYGVRPFLPFSGKWYAWDILFHHRPVGDYGTGGGIDSAGAFADGGGGGGSKEAKILLGSRRGASLHGAPVGSAGHLSSAGSGYAGSLQLRSGSSSEHRRLSLDG